MFKVGDVVIYVDLKDGSYRGSLTDGKEYVVLHSSDRYTKVANDIGTFSVCFHKRFKLKEQPVPADDGVIRLRCVEGLRPHLRVGDVYSVKIEGNTYYTLNEIPGKKYKKDRFERLVEAPKPVAEPRELQIGDEVIVVKVIPNPLPGIGWVTDMEKAYMEKHIIKVTSTVYKKNAHRQEEAFNGHAPSGAVWLWPLQYFTFADGSPIKGGAVVKDIPKKAPRPVKDTDEIKEGDEFIVTSIDRKWALAYLDRHRVKEELIGKKLVVQNKHGVIKKLHNEGAYVWFKVDKALFDHYDKMLAIPIKCLAWAEEGVELGNKRAITKPIVEEPKLQNIYEYAAKHMKKSNELCSWIIQRKGAKQYDEQVNWPCYAGLQNGTPVEQLIISMFNKDRYITTPLEKEQYDEWLKYVIEESPFRVSFLTKTAEEAKEKHLLMDCSRARDELITSATAMRDGYEHKERLPVFTFFVEEGYSKHTAYLMAYMLNYGNGKWSLSGMGNGHTNMDGTQDIDEVCKFFRVGYNNKLWAGEPKYNVTGGGFRGMYRLIAESNDKNSMRKFAQSFAKANGEGWNVNYTMDEASAKKLADAIEAKIKGQPEEKKKVDEEIPF